MTSPFLRRGDPCALGLVPARLEHVTALMHELVATGAVAGLAVAVARTGQLAFASYAGRRARATEHVVDAHTLWSAASLTKPVAATALLLLAERGILTLEDSVARWWPAFAAGGKETVTLRHVLTHTAGIDETFQQAVQAAGWSPDAYYRALGQTGLTWAPGTRAAYNNAGFGALAPVIRAASGVPHQEFIAREVFAPLGVTNTSLGGAWESVHERLATVDGIERGLLARLYQEANLAGGMVTTAVDMAAFGSLFLQDGVLGERRLLTPDSVQAMLRDHADGLDELESDGTWQPAAGRGLAWRLNVRPTTSFGALASRRAFGHGGATGTLLLIDPEHDLVISIMANRWGWGGAERARLVDAVYAAQAGAHDQPRQRRLTAQAGQPGGITARGQ